MPSRKMAKIFAHCCRQESLFLHISRALGVTNCTNGILSSTLLKYTTFKIGWSFRCYLSLTPREVEPYFLCLLAITQKNVFSVNVHLSHIY